MCSRSTTTIAGARQANRAKFERAWRGSTSSGAETPPMSRMHCREYVSDAWIDRGARRDLEDLRAAINHHCEGRLSSRGRWRSPCREGSTSRSLADPYGSRRSHMGCCRTREIQTPPRAAAGPKGRYHDKYPLRHLARFILFGLYTGTRAGAISTASPTRGRSMAYVDLEHGHFLSACRGPKATNKRQPPVPIPPRLLAHMRRWRRSGNISDHVSSNGTANR